jgi:hypothetical protein
VPPCHRKTGVKQGSNKDGKGVSKILDQLMKTPLDQNWIKTGSKFNCDLDQKGWIKTHPLQGCGGLLIQPLPFIQ